jgi:superfamily II DNA or RNA helicase
MELRSYQKECIDAIPESGRYLIQMATGLGKTVTFSQIPRKGRMLIVSHREELVNQPEKYFSCSYGIEQASQSSDGEEVVSASIQSLHRRLPKFDPASFDIVVIDEAHHAAGQTYLKVVDHFKPRLLLGFTATPNRSDDVGLDSIFDKIIFERDLEWGIKNKHLCNIHCIRANVGFDLDGIKTKLGDFDNKELEREMIEGVVVQATADAYRDHAIGQTLIFTCSVKHSEMVASLIPGAVSVTGNTKDRSEIFNKFMRKEIKCIVNCMVLTEGTDLPCIETIIMARPTKSPVLYTQAVGRGTRLHEGKDRLLLIDCVGVTDTLDLCSASTLLGLDINSVSDKEKLEGDIFDLPQKVVAGSDVIESWIKNIDIVQLFAKRKKYRLYDVNYFKMPNGAMIVQLPEKVKITISPIDKLERCTVRHSDGRIKRDIKAQEAFDLVFKTLRDNHSEASAIWSLQAVKKWGSKDASDKQKAIISRYFPKYDVSRLTKMEAGCILNRLFNR